MASSMKLAFAVVAVVGIATQQSAVPNGIVFMCNRDGADNACIQHNSE